MMRLINRKSVRLISTFVFVASCFHVAQSFAAEIKILAIGATAPALKQIIPEFEKASGEKVTAWFGPPGQIVDKITSGETVDLVFVDGPRYDDLVKSGAIDTGIVIARLAVGIGIPKGSIKPDVSTADALKRTLLAAKSVGGLPSNNGSIGTAVFAGFRKLGIEDQIVPKYHIYPNGISVVQALTKGEIELGFSVIADMAAAPDIDYAGPYPPGIQSYRPIHATMRIGSSNEGAVKSFLDLVRNSATPDFLRKNWLFPAED